MSGNLHAHCQAKKDLILVVGFTLACLVLAHAFDLAEAWYEWSQAHESLQVDEIPFAIALAAVGLAYFSVRRWLDFLEQLAAAELIDAELQEQKSMLNSVIENVPLALCLKDCEGRFTLVNPGFQRLHGLGADEVLGKTFFDILPHKIADDAVAEDRQVVETGEVLRTDYSWPEELGFRHELIFKFPLRPHDQGAITGVGVIALDVTEQKRIEAALRAAKDAAEAANRAKSEFLAAVSHELRTPLNAIIGFSEILKDTATHPRSAEKSAEYASHINSSGQNLLNLINDILDLSKVDSGTDVLQEQEVDVQGIIESIARLVEHRAHQCEVKLRFDAVDDLPLLRADERKLKQILVQLLSNAIKFTGPGGIVVLRSWGHRDSGFVFQVADTGIGIAAKDIPKALTKFGQVDGDLNRRYDGTGLGLPLTKAFVEQHQGSLELKSRPGVGTTVTVRFPAKRIVSSLDNPRSSDVKTAAS